MTEIKELKPAAEMRRISLINEEDDYDYKELREWFIELIESTAAKGDTWVKLDCHKLFGHTWSRFSESYERKLPGMFSRFLEELIDKDYCVFTKELEAEVWWGEKPI